MLTRNKYPGIHSVKTLTENLLNKGILSLFILLLIATSITACRIDMVAGQEPCTDILEASLHLGESGMDDILQVLGKPNGKGGFMLPNDPAGRTTWSYYFEKGSVVEQRGGRISGESKRGFLFIYFDNNDKYDDYIWFSGRNNITNY